MSREITPASRAEKPSEVGAPEGLAGRPRRAERQRGRWNFLTWSFFLAEVAAGAQFLGTGAKAQGDDAAHAKGHGEATDAIHDGVLASLGSVTAATEEGGSGPAASRAEAPSSLAELNLLSLQQGDEAGGPLGNTGDVGFGGASSSGSGSSGTGSNGGQQADSGGPPPVSDEPPTGVLPPISDGPPLGVWPPISDSPPSGASPPILDNPVTGLLPPISIGVTVSNLLDTTLDQLTGLHLVETVGGLLGNTVEDTLSQITGLVGNAGELTAVVGGLLDSSLNVAFSATESLIPQAAGSVVSSVGALASSVTDLGLFGDSGHLSSDGTVSQIVYSASSVVEDAGNILNAQPGNLMDVLKASAMVSPALNIVLDAPEITPLSHDQAVSSGGTIAFPDLASATVLHVDELFAGGRYTDYGLAVQSEGNSGATAIVDPLGGDADTSTLSSPIDSPSESHESALSPGVPDVNASSLNLPNIIDELGVRDHSI